MATIARLQHLDLGAGQLSADEHPHPPVVVGDE
jgi:hypothetical protein